MLGLTPLTRTGIQKRNAGDVFDLFNIFDDLLNDGQYTNKPSRIANFRVDLKDENDHYVVEAELPGFKKEEVSLDYEEGRLIISAKRNEETTEEKDNYLHRERKLCSMQRAIYLKDVKSEEIDATLEDGILKIVIPKIERTTNKRTIEIK